MVLGTAGRVGVMNNVRVRCLHMSVVASSCGSRFHSVYWPIIAITCGCVEVEIEIRGLALGYLRPRFRLAPWHRFQTGKTKATNSSYTQLGS